MPRAYNKPEFGPCAPVAAALLTDWGVSASKEGEPKHPSKKVVNAFKRRGAEVFATQGNDLVRRSKDAPNRQWGSASPLPFYSQVEE